MLFRREGFAAEPLLVQHVICLFDHQHLEVLVPYVGEPGHFTFLDEGDVVLGEVDSQVQEGASDFNRFELDSINSLSDIIEVELGNVQVLSRVAVSHLVKSFDAGPESLDLVQKLLVA